MTVVLNSGLFSSILKNMLMVSLMGSFLALVLIILSPLAKNMFSKKWNYYVWILVALRLVIPMGLPVYLVTDFFTSTTYSVSVPLSIELPLTSSYSYSAPNAVSASDWVIPNYNSSATQYVDNSFINNNLSRNINPFTFVKDLAARFINRLRAFIPLATLSWLIVAAVLFIRKIVKYQSFIYSILPDTECLDNDVVLDMYDDVCKQLGIRRHIPVFISKKATSPMLIGLFNPSIILPTAHLQNPTLKYVFMHELIHYKRRDIWVKWIAQFALCVHWFNPFAYIAVREISKNCELSCDEAVIERLGTEEQRAYGDTLISSLAMNESLAAPQFSLPLSQSSKLMKERLGAIMWYSERSKTAVFLSIFLTIVLCFGSLFTGVYAQPTPQATPMAMAMESAPTMSEEVVAYTSDPYFLDPEPGYANVDTFYVPMETIGVDLPIPTGEIFVEKIDTRYMSTGDEILVELGWDRDGAVMFLYTTEEFDTDTIVKYVEKGVLPLDITKSTNNYGYNDNQMLSSNFSYYEDGREIKLNFAAAPTVPIGWKNYVPESGNYNLYIIAAADNGLSHIWGSVLHSRNNSFERLERIRNWSGSIGEIPIKNGFAIKAQKYIGDKTNMSFTPERGNSYNFTFNADIQGDFTVFFVTKDREIIKSVPQFNGTNQIVLENLPEIEISMIFYAFEASGTLEVEMVERSLRQN